MGRSASKVMVSLRLDRDTLDDLDLMVRQEGFRSRRELLQRAFEEYRELRRPKHNVHVLRVRMPKSLVKQMDFLISIGDQTSWESIVVKAVEQYLVERTKFLRSLPEEQELIRKGLKEMGGGGMSLEI